MSDRDVFDADEAVDRLFREVYSEDLRGRWRPGRDSRSARRISERKAEQWLKSQFQRAAKALIDEHGRHIRHFLDKEKGSAAIVATLAVEQLEDPPDEAEAFLADCVELQPRWLHAGILGYLAAVKRLRSRFTRE